MDPWIILSAIFLSVQAVCPFVSDANHPPYRYNKFINEHYDSLLVDYIIKNDHYSVEYGSFEEEFRNEVCMDWSTADRNKLMNGLKQLDFKYFIPVFLSKCYAVPSNAIVENQHIDILYTSEPVNPILDRFFEIVADSLWDDPMIKKSIDIVCEQDYDLKVYYKGCYSETGTALVKNAVIGLFVNCRNVMWANPDIAIDFNSFNNSTSLKSAKLYHERISPEGKVVLGGDLSERNEETSIDPLRKFAEESPLLRADQMPEFPGGVEAMMKYIYANIQYPKEAIENGIQGRVTVQFVVSKTGAIEDINVIGKLDPVCDKEAVRVIQGMPKWIPGKQNGKAVPVYFIVPVIFGLQ